MLSKMDEDGFVEIGSVGVLAHLANIAPQDASEAVARLEAKHEDTTDEFSGRLIERVSGGWIVLDHLSYSSVSAEDRSLDRVPRISRSRSRQLWVSQKCVYCVEPATGIDHVVPRAAGGSDDERNLVPCCIRCNRYKNARNLTEFLNDRTLPFDLDHESIQSNSILTYNASWCGSRYESNSFTP